MIYKYEAVNKNTGMIEYGTLELHHYESPEVVLPDFLSVLNVKADIPAYVRSLFKKRMPYLEISRLFRYMERYQKMGVSTPDALETIMKTYSGKYKHFFENLIGEIKDGKQFSMALSSSGIIPPLVTTLVRAGEDTGSLDMVYHRLKEFYEKSASAKSRTQREMIYPMIVLVILILVLFFVAFFLMPKLHLLIGELSKGKMPIPTKIVFFIFGLFRKGWWLIPPALILLIAGVLFIREVRPIQFYKKVLKLPVIGNIFRYTYLSQIFAYLEIFQANGIDLLRALDNMVATIRNRYISGILKKCADMLRIGESFSNTLTGDFFPPYVKQSVSIGEEQGALEGSFRDVSDFYGEELERALKGLSVFVGAILTLLMGAFILIIGVSVFLAVYYGIGTIRS